MKLNNIRELQEFLAIVNSCEALLEQKGSELELYCSSREDEVKFIGFFHRNPEAV